MHPAARCPLVLIGASAALLAGCHQEVGPMTTAPTCITAEVLEQRWAGGELRLRKEVLRHPDGAVVDHGLHTTWYENGQESYQGVFVHGQLHGAERAWHANGQLRTEANYVHGLRHGPRFSWDEQGRLRKVEHYAEDKPDGTWQVYQPDGSLKWEGRFEKGLPVP
jgi:hypothetical protein